MNTTVNFEIAKLLKEQGFNRKCFHHYDKYINEKPKLKVGDTTWLQCVNWNDVKHNLTNCTVLSAPTIAETIMWLYEKHSLWILPLPTITGHFSYKIVDVQLNPENPIERPPYKDVSANDYTSPTEAYSEAILYALENLI